MKETDRETPARGRHNQGGDENGKSTLNQALWNCKYLNTWPPRDVKLCLGFRVQGRFQMGPLNVSTSMHILKHFT